MIWFSHFGELFLGKMDPKTGKVWRVSVAGDQGRLSDRSLDLKTDKEGNLWLGMMYQSSIARFDKKTETFKVWSIPKDGRPTPPSLGISIPRARISTARCG